MYDISEFVKTVKQRFSMWYNHKEGRRGTLWEDPPSLGRYGAAGRFKSVIVGDSQFALQAMAAYIDLNPVRAGIVASSLSASCSTVAYVTSRTAW